MVDRKFQVRPWSSLRHTRMLLRRWSGSAPTPAGPAHNSVPAGMSPTCLGSSYSVEQHIPFLFWPSGSWISPSGWKLAPSSVLS